MDELVRWLGQQLDEDERIARRLLNDTRPGRAERWEFCDDGAIRDTSERRSLRVKFTWSPEAEHIVRHDPARVLREIDAKRLALDHLVELQRLAKGGVAIYRAAAGAVEVQIQIMALAYTDRPGYQEAWRPEHLD